MRTRTPMATRTRMPRRSSRAASKPTSGKKSGMKSGGTSGGPAAFFCVVDLRSRGRLLRPVTVTLRELLLAQRTVLVGVEVSEVRGESRHLRLHLVERQLAVA